MRKESDLKATRTRKPSTFRIYMTYTEKLNFLIRDRGFQWDGTGKNLTKTGEDGKKLVIDRLLKSCTFLDEFGKTFAVKEVAW